MTAESLRSRWRKSKYEAASRSCSRFASFGFLVAALVVCDWVSDILSWRVLDRGQCSHKMNHRNMLGQSIAGAVSKRQTRHSHKLYRYAAGFGPIAPQARLHTTFVSIHSYAPYREASSHLLTSKGAARAARSARARDDTGRSRLS